MIVRGFFFSLAILLIQGQSLSAQTKRGRMLFIQNCSACHNFQQDGIGPQLGGLASEVSRDWLLSFITDPQKKIDMGDKRVDRLLEHFSPVMPTFSQLAGEDLKAIVDYILEQPAPLPKEVRNYGIPVEDPIPERIPMSELVLNIEPYVKIPPSNDTKPLARISLMKFDPISKDNYIADLRGKLYRIKEGRAEVYLDVAEVFPNFIDQPGLATGFGAFAFHPNFEINGLFYTTHSEAPASAKADFDYADSINVTIQWVLTEWKTNDPFAFPAKATPRELFRVDMVSGMHGIQDIGFNPLAKKQDKDYGILYVAVGDGAAVQMGAPHIPHSKNGIWGCILRIDPKGKNSENGKYGFPLSNPFVGGKNKGEIYAMGFRNPHRFTWTSTGKFLVVNIGQNSVETINLVQAGSDFGWPMREGRLRINELGDLNLAYEIPPNENLHDFNLPAIEIDHDEIGAISSVYEYTGHSIPALKGKLLFSSISKARLFYVEEKEVIEGARAKVKEFRVSLDGKITNFNDLCGNKWRADLRLGRDAEGEIYFFTKRDGMVYKIVP